MSGPGRKDLGPRDHVRSLAALCGVCGRKRPGLRNITATIADQIRRIVIPSFSLDSGLHPTSICSTCRQTLASSQEVNKLIVISIKIFATTRSLTISYHIMINFLYI